MTRRLTGVRADQKHSYRGLEKYAHLVREHLKLSPLAALDALRLFENLDEISITTKDGVEIPFRSGVVALEDSEGYVRYDRSNNVMEMLASEVTYDRIESGNPRGVYFVAHELGHCLLHTDQLVRLAKMPTELHMAYNRRRADHQPYEDTEWQANAFASALLMPARGIQALEQEHNAINSPLIAMQFRVSLEAARYRLDLYKERKEQLLG
jgi:Zn-dependent peptidase ImmA (M78 family)